MKRAVDVLASAAGLVVLSPLMAVVALAVRATSPGPVLFRQERVGRGDTRFEILKFRTMRVGGSGPLVTTHADPRVTRVGAWLRRTKVDELPQLLNVLRGEMSLVGPRPEVPRYTQHWPREQASVILSVRPGITDPASIAFRDENALMAGQTDPERFYVEEMLPRKATMYVEYVENRTFLGDLRLIARTILP